MSRDGYLPGGVTESDIERHFGTLSPADANEIQRRLEEKAEDEAAEGADVFREWLVEGVDYNGGGCIALVLQAFDERDAGTWDLRIYEARNTLLRDWVQYRVNSFPEDVVKQVQDDVMGVEA